MTSGVGALGPDKGHGGKFLLVPPGYKGDLPTEGYFVTPSRMNDTTFFIRAMVVNGDVAGAVALLKRARIYPYSQRDNPKPNRFFDVSNKPAVGFAKEMSSAFLNIMRFAISQKNGIQPVPEAAKAALGANAQNSYYGGNWDLNDNQALLIEVTPTKAAYWSIVAQNFWIQGLAHESIPAFVNLDTAVPDTDGKIRVIVSAKDPGYANWICTGGLRIGMITVRWNEKEGEEHMEAKLVNFDQISEAMPAKSAKVNPEDRQQLLQALRSHILRRYGR